MVSIISKKINSNSTKTFDELRNCVYCDGGHRKIFLILKQLVWFIRCMYFYVTLIDQRQDFRGNDKPFTLPETSLGISTFLTFLCVKIVQNFLSVSLFWSLYRKSLSCCTNSFRFSIFICWIDWSSPSPTYTQNLYV